MPEVIKIKSIKETLDVRTNILDMVLKISYKFNNHYDNDMARLERNIVRAIEDKIIDIVTDRYMMEFADQVIKKIDLETIVKRVQLQVVQRINQ